MIKFAVFDCIFSLKLLLLLLHLLPLLLLPESFVPNVLLVIKVAEEPDEDDVSARSDVDGLGVAEAVEAGLDVEPGADEDEPEVELDDLRGGHVALPRDGDLEVAHQVVRVHQDVDERVEEHHPWEGEQLVVEPHPGNNEHD